MGAIASQITSLTVVYSTVYSDAHQIKHQSSASLAFVRGIHRGPVNSLHKSPVTRKMFSFDDVIMCQSVGKQQKYDRSSTRLFSSCQKQLGLEIVLPPGKFLSPRAIDPWIGDPWICEWTNTKHCINLYIILLDDCQYFTCIVWIRKNVACYLLLICTSLFCKSISHTRSSNISIAIFARV